MPAPTPRPQRLIALVCGHQVPYRNLNKIDDDVAWCACCQRWLVTGQWPGQDFKGICLGRAPKSETLR